MSINLWSNAQHSRDYLQRADSIPHRREGESTLLEFLPAQVNRFLDVGAGGGRLLSLVKSARPNAQCVALDFSTAMLEELRKQFATDKTIGIVAHDLSNPLPDIGAFDAAVSSFAIHHVTHERKRTLYAEIFALLTPETEDPSNKLLDLEIQLTWLCQIGFTEVDCHWKWRELALLAGTKPLRYV
jgi:tRNA (cmo5U34)-methyltransferase